MFEEMGHQNPNFYSTSLSPRILIVDDESSVAEEMGNYLRLDGYSIDVVGSAEAALQAFIRKTYHLIFVDVFLSGRSAIDFIHLLKEVCPQCVIILLIGPAPLQVPSDVLDLSAIPCLSKPIAPYVLRKRVHDLLQKREQDPPSRLLSLDRSQGILWEGMRTRSQKMREIFDNIRLISQTDSTILITGEHGTGKKLIAKAIHNQSKRQKGPFLCVQTKTIPRDRMISDLFGNDDRGYSFDGSFRGKLGMAVGGTLFLDEFFLLDERTLLRFQRFLEATASPSLNSRPFRTADIRIIFGTHVIHASGPKTKTPHHELLDRLHPFQIALPPLRDRPEDITPLCYEFLSIFSIQHRKLLGIIPAETRRLLEHYSWPGNIRELRHVIEQAVLLSRSSVFEPELLPYRIYHAASGGKVISIPLGWSLAQAEKEIIWRTLEANQKNKKGTAEALGISRRSLYNKLANYFHASIPETEL